MLRDPNHRAILIEGLIAGGLIAIGCATGLGPLLTLSSTAVGAGSNWAFSLAERGFQHWRDSWLTEHGVLNQAISEALSHAFKNAIGALEREWKRHPHYLRLRHTNPDAAQLTLVPLRLLHEDTTNLFQQPERLALAFQYREVSFVLHWDENRARHFLTDKLSEYLYGHDEVLVDFVKRRLVDEWLLQFERMLRDPSEEGTLAWRAYQRLWYTSLETALGQLEQNTTQTVAAMRWLQEWAQRLEYPLRDLTGEAALEEALRPVCVRLDEFKVSLERTKTGVERIEESLQRVESAVSGDKQYIVPFLAPPLPSHILIGRDTVLHELKHYLLIRKTLTLTALNGLPGAGKTTLAIALAHDPDVREHFSDGVLWAGLGQGAQEADILSYLGIWGTALGISQTELEMLPDVRARQRRIQVAIGQRKMLLVADDVWKVEIALNLKLGGDNCAYLVTTRLPIVAVQLSNEGIMMVQELNEDDSLRLLEQFAPEMVKDAPVEARTLAQAVGGLPLALTLVGKYLRTQIHTQQTPQQRRRHLQTALEQLRQSKVRLQLEQPQVGLEHHPSLPPDTPLSLKASIDISYKALGKEARRMLRALSVFPSKPNSFSEEAALAVSAASVRTLDILTDAGLLESSGQDRHMLHQTIVDYLRVKRTEVAVEERMAEYFSKYVEAHALDYDALEQETSNVYTALQAASKRGMQEALIRGANAFAPFLQIRGMYALAEDNLKEALSAAKSLGDKVGWATILLNLGSIAEKCGDYVQAEVYLREGLALARQIGHRERISALLQYLGTVVRDRGDYAKAKEYLQEGLVLARQIEHPERISALLFALGVVADYQGDYAQAEAYYLEGLALARQIGHQELIGLLLTNLGGIELKCGNYTQAEVHLQEGLALARQIGHRASISSLLQNLGSVASNQGNYTQAEVYWQEGLALARQIGHRVSTAFLLQSLGTLASDRGDYAQAEAYFQEGLELARGTGYQGLISFVLQNLGTLASDRGDYTQAEAYFQEGLKLARQMRYPELISLVLQNLGALASNQGNYAQAEAYFQEGLELAHQIKQQKLISIILNKRGQLNLKMLNLNAAYADFRDALAIAPKGNQELIALAQYGLAQTMGALGHYSTARDYGEASITIFEKMGHSRALEVRQWLDRLPIIGN